MDSRKPVKTDLLAAPGNREVFAKLIQYSMYMFVVPLITFFAFWRVLLPLFRIGDDSTQTTISAIAAVISVNIVIVKYVKEAFAEDVSMDNKEKED